MNTHYSSYLTGTLFILAALLLNACSSGGGDGGGGDTTAPTALVSPVSDATISASSGNVAISFSESMDTTSLLLGGSMGQDSDGGTWSKTAVDNDTLTISPTDGWNTGIGSLTVAANDVAGNALSPLDLSYLIIPLLLDNFQAASVVIGQADFLGNFANQGGMHGANTLAGVVGAPSQGSLYLADTDNHRILGFNAIPATNNANADFVIGQADFSSSAPGTMANGFNFPFTTVTADGRLFVVDQGNHRVLIWNSLPTANVPADVVLGQADFLSNLANQGGTPGANTLAAPFGLAVAGGRMFVADRGNNRVLIWSSVPTSNNVPADVVIGQVDFTSNLSGLSATQLSDPTSIWSDGQRIALADSRNNRVLIWNTIPTSNGAAADLVIGQPDFISNAESTTSQTLISPFGVYSNGLQLFISDIDANRVLIFDNFPTSNQPSADRILGQSNFTNFTPNDDDQNGTQEPTPTARTLFIPVGINAIGNRLFVSDNLNHRVLIYQGN